ncbi:Lrp/AsnC family transcriptional regulator [Aquitalea sp. LB_tupeE]|uniref:siroheme decarboxylase subunit beta n=1 Tax=Aquitalea sp. LB_tupeE TaxID=2748078 RepID=UPI0015BB55CD|nr:Lrp/AsnC family transcriptional regulator [Aquitalea sp. LB_tupeE]NWK78809.1 Lrp/AsnC family transcriptional regulator [Aquitalea sp. LB_tupeE]
MDCSNQLSSLEVALINTLQDGFPIVQYPFHEVADAIGVTEGAVLNCLKNLLDKNLLTRFGPLFQIEKMGGVFVLAAMSVPEERFDIVSAYVNSLTVIAHNYRREHSLNMWFVFAAENYSEIVNSAEDIEKMSGCKVILLPKEREYFIGMRFRVGEDVPVGATSATDCILNKSIAISEIDRQLIKITQSGLPICQEPYKEVGREIGLDPIDVMKRLQYWVDVGLIRRIGAVPNHYSLGFLGNGMAVFDVDDDVVDEFGIRLGALDEVSHCYRRPRSLPDWPYNLFVMLHGKDNSAVLDSLSVIKAILGDRCQNSDILFSSKILKKTGLRIN